MYEDIVRNIETAIANGRTDIVLALIESYKKANDVNRDEIPLKTFLNSYLAGGCSFLQLATKLNQTDIARALLLFGSDPGLQDINGRNAVDLAANSSQMTALYQQELFRVTAASDLIRINQLLDAGVDVNCRDSASSSNRPLHWAVTFADSATVACLLERGADVNATNCNGATPLFDAITRGDLEIVQLLLRRGVNLNVRATGKFCNQTAFDLAAAQPDILMALQDQFNVNTPNREIDIEQQSDSTTSSWVNEYGSHEGSRESLIMLDNEALLSSSLFDSPQSQDEITFIEENFKPPQIISQSPIVAVHENKQECKASTECMKMLKLLWPAPRRLEVVAGDVSIPKRLEVSFVENQDSTMIHKTTNLWHMHEPVLSKCGYTLAFHGICNPGQCADCEGIIYQITPNLFPNKSGAFSLSILSQQIRIVAADVSGLFYAIKFLVQYLTLFSDQQVPPAIKVMDWPAWPCRGTSINISNLMPVPKLKSIREFIDVMANFRMNCLFLFMSFSTDGAVDSAFSPSDVLGLDEYCQNNCISLLPAMELEAAVDEDFRLEHFYKLISACLSHFSSRRYFLFGKNATDLLRKLSNECGHFLDLPFPLDTCLYLDVSGLQEDSPFFTMLPLNVILVRTCEIFWGRQKTSSFQHEMAASGFPYSIIANVALSNSMTGCSEVLLSPFQSLASSLCSSGTSLLLSNSLQAESISPTTFQVPGLFFGAGMAWNPNIKLPEILKSLPDLLDIHAFGKTGLGAAIMRLSSIECTLAGHFPANGSSFVHRVITQPDAISLDGLTPEKLQKSVRDIKLCLASLPTIPSDDANIQLVLEEIHLVADLLLFSCRLCRNLLVTGKNPNPIRASGLSVINVGLSNLPSTNRTDLANRLLELTHHFQKLWLRRNLPGGLQISLQIFNRLFHQLIPRTGLNDIISI